MTSADLNDVIQCENKNIKEVEEHVKNVYHVCCQKKVLTHSLKQKRCVKKSRNKNASSLCHETLSKNTKPRMCKSQPTSRYMQCMSKCNNGIRSIMLGIALAMVSGLKYTKCGYSFGCETVREVHKQVKNAVIVHIKEKWRTLQLSLSPVSGRHGISSCVWDTVKDRSDSGSQTKIKCSFEGVETIGNGPRDVQTQSSLKLKTNGQLTDGPLSWVPSYKPGEKKQKRVKEQPHRLDRHRSGRPDPWGPPQSAPPRPALNAPAPAESHTAVDGTATGPGPPSLAEASPPEAAQAWLANAANRYKVSSLTACISSL